MLPLVFFILPAPLNSMHRFKLEIFEEKISAICSKVAAILSFSANFLKYDRLQSYTTGADSLIVLYSDSSTGPPIRLQCL